MSHWVRRAMMKQRLWKPQEIERAFCCLPDAGVKSGASHGWFGSFGFLDEKGQMGSESRLMSDFVRSDENFEHLSDKFARS